MKIRYLKIENFRGIKSFEAKFVGDFICLIGPGDSCKTTILDAIELALSTKWNVNLDDSDFHKLDYEGKTILIEVALTDWSTDDPLAVDFIHEEKFGQLIGGLGPERPQSEPAEGCPPCFTVQFKLDQTLEPKWLIVKDADTKQLTSNDRRVFGVGKLDAHLDFNFTWGKGSILSKLFRNPSPSLDGHLTEIARSVRSQNTPVESLRPVADAIKDKARSFGVEIVQLLSRVDIQKLNPATGNVVLHDDTIPLRGFGSGTKKLVSCAIQSEVNNGKNIAIIDELETGLEPHRIRGLIQNLRASQQVFTTTHSPVVIRELKVADHELYVCQKDIDGNVKVKSVADVPNIQGAVRTNAEALLGKKMVVCEGPTEIGILRALDQFKISSGAIPVWALGTSYFNAGGAGSIAPVAIKLKSLGYQVCVLADNDAQDQFGPSHISDLDAKGITTITWDEGLSTESQLFKSITWSEVPALIHKLAEAREEVYEDFLISIRANNPTLNDAPENWADDEINRRALSQLAGRKSWFKRIDLAEAVFAHAIPNIPADNLMRTRLDQIWTWITNG